MRCLVSYLRYLGSVKERYFKEGERRLYGAAEASHDGALPTFPCHSPCLGTKTKICNPTFISFTKLEVRELSLFNTLDLLFGEQNQQYFVRHEIQSEFFFQTKPSQYRQVNDHYIIGRQQGDVAAMIKEKLQCIDSLVTCPVVTFGYQYFLSTISPIAHTLVQMQFSSVSQVPFQVLQGNCRSTFG